MTATAAHTPRPWRVETPGIADEGTRTILAPSGDALARMSHSGNGANLAANAERIVLAVNCHDELLAALKGLVPIVADLDSIREAGEPETPELVAARAAIAKAEGRQ